MPSILTVLCPGCRWVQRFVLRDRGPMTCPECKALVERDGEGVRLIGEKG